MLNFTIWLGKVGGEGGITLKVLLMLASHYIEEFDLITKLMLEQDFEGTLVLYYEVKITEFA